MPAAATSIRKKTVPYSGVRTVILDKDPPLSQNSARNRLAGRVEALVREGSMVRVSLDCGFPLRALVTNQACQELALREGEHVIALLKAPAIPLVPRG